MSKKKNKATLADFSRMCRSMNSCEKCPIAEAVVSSDFSCSLFIRGEADRANAIVLRWCKEHPVETRQSKFLTMFPNAEVTSDYLDICPQKIDKTYNCKFNQILVINVKENIGLRRYKNENTPL